MTITGIMADFLDSIRAYEHESESAIAFDERESFEFVDMYFNGGGKIKIEEKEPLFITDDGVEVFDRNTIVYNVRNNTLAKLEISAVYLNEHYFEHKVFFHESNADEYILWNKRLFSYNDMVMAKKSVILEEEDIIRIAKERIEE